jgi:hypothetical protein
MARATATSRDVLDNNRIASFLHPFIDMFCPSCELPRQLVQEPTSGLLVLARKLPWPKPRQYSEPKKAKSRLAARPARAALLARALVHIIRNKRQNKRRGKKTTRRIVFLDTSFP